MKNCKGCYYYKQYRINLHKDRHVPMFRTIECYQYPDKDFEACEYFKQKKLFDLKDIIE